MLYVLPGVGCVWGWWLLSAVLYVLPGVGCVWGWWLLGAVLYVLPGVGCVWGRGYRGRGVPCCGGCRVRLGSAIMSDEFNPDRPADMGPLYRDEAWRRLGSEQFDIVVVGGGVVGVGAALDAATRGLRVALVEARDIASGTSSRSSKMFHGDCDTWNSSNSVWSVRLYGNVNCR